MQTIEHDIKKYDKYFITKDFNDFKEITYLKKIEKVLKLGIKIIQFRSKNLSITEYSNLSKKIFELCRKYNAIYIINDYKNFINNKYCDGIHFTSKNLLSINDACHKLDNFFLLGSCHNFEEINICNMYNFNIITLSPVKNTNNKAGFGWKKFNSLAEKAKMPVYALGGLNYEKDIATAKKNGAIGIAASSYFHNL